MNISTKTKEILKIDLGDQVLEYEVPIMRKEEFKTKNMNQCNGNPLRPGNQICIYFYKISSLCLIIG
jgi:hypothetical protein